MSWVCSEFGATPREALSELGYDPDDAPWNLMPLIGEWRGLKRIHAEFERIMSASAGKGWSEDLDRLKKNPLWPVYADALEAEAHGRG